MKKYTDPEIEIVKFEAADIMTASVPDNVLPIAPVSDLRENQLNIVSLD